jgi:lipopolysaccharide exporter
MTQVLAIVASPIMTRLYGPQAFGIAALFASMTGIVAAIACLRYEQAVMLPEADAEAANVLAACGVFVAAVTALTSVLAWFAGPLLRLLRAEEIRPYVWMMPLAVLMAGLFIALNQWNSRTKQFGRLSVVRVTNSVVTTGSQLAAGSLGYATGESLIGASVLGSTVATGTLAWKIWREDGRLFRQSWNLGEIRRLVKRHRNFPLYGTWSILLNSLSWQLPTFFLSASFSSSVVGYYALGTSLLRLPMDLIGGAIGLVFFERAARARLEGALPRLVEETFRRLVSLGLFPLLLLTFIGRDLFVLVFGAKWAEAGVYTQILSVWMFFWFVSSPLITLFSVLVIFTTRLLALWLGGRSGDARLALAFFGLSGLVVYGGMNLSLMAAAGYPWSSSARLLLSSLLRFLPAGAVLLILGAVGATPIVRVATATGILGLYLIYILRTDTELRRLLERAFLGRRAGA